LQAVNLSSNYLYCKPAVLSGVNLSVDNHNLPICFNQLKYKHRISCSLDMSLELRLSKLYAVALSSTELAGVD